MKKGMILCFCLILLLLGGCTQDKASSGRAEKTQEYPSCFILLDDLMEGKDKFVMVHY